MLCLFIVVALLLTGGIKVTFRETEAQFCKRMGLTNDDDIYVRADGSFGII